jgi:hypothetical protein
MTVVEQLILRKHNVPNVAQHADQCNRTPTTKSSRPEIKKFSAAMPGRARRQTSTLRLYPKGALLFRWIHAENEVRVRAERCADAQSIGPAAGDTLDTETQATSLITSILSHSLTYCPPLLFFRASWLLNVFQ